jgi:hypothetical protein
MVRMMTLTSGLAAGGGAPDASDASVGRATGSMALLNSAPCRVQALLAEWLND